MSRFDDEWQLLLSFRGWIRERGYRLVDRRGPEGMNQGFHVHVGDLLGIRIEVDRDQWFIDVHPGQPTGDWHTGEDWFGLEDWSTCLGDPVLFHDTRPLESDRDWLEVLATSWHLRPQLDYLVGHIPRIEQRCEPTHLADTIDCLRGARRAAWRREDWPEGWPEPP